MATKKDLVEAQSFSRRRLLTAFTSGAPGGKELEPAQPLRAVVAAVVLTAMVILAGVFYGLLQPGLPKGWENDRLILAKDTGARYVSARGVLHPVINTASARLLIPASKFAVVSTDSGSLSGIDIGSTVGILGGPDTLPPPASLVGDGWTACVTPSGGTAVGIGTGPNIRRTDDGVVVQSGDRVWVVSEGLRYAVPDAERDPVLRAVGLDAASVVDVDDTWLNLFTPGAALDPLAVQDAGRPVGATGLTVGEVVHQEGRAQTDRFLVTTDGTLARIGPLAFAMWQLGTGSAIGDAREVGAAVLDPIPNATSLAGGVDWPQRPLSPIETGSGTCALLTHEGSAPRTVLATAAAPPGKESVTVAPGAGALVSARGAGAESGALRYLVDGSGTAYAIPGTGTESLERLGYRPSDIDAIGAGWVRFLPAGPSLTQRAAGAAPRAGGS